MCQVQYAIIITVDEVYYYFHTDSLNRYDEKFTERILYYVKYEMANFKIIRCKKK